MLPDASRSLKRSILGLKTAVFGGSQWFMFDTCLISLIDVLYIYRFYMFNVCLIYVSYVFNLPLYAIIYNYI